MVHEYKGGDVADEGTTPDSASGATAEGGTGRAGGLPDRKARLAALKARRPAVPDAGDDSQPKRPRVALAQRAAGKAGQGDGGGRQQNHQQMIMRVYKLLTRTPDDGSGMVPGTPFTRAGVTELMTLLHERAAQPGSPGAKVAGNAIEFLKPAEADEELVAGASVTKLQQVARMASRFGAA